MTTYCILGAGSLVETTFANSQLPTAPNGYTEIPVDGGQVGEVWNGTAFVAGPTPVPQSVSAAQMMMALSQQTYYGTLSAYIATLPAQDQMAFNRTENFDRGDVIINTLAVNVPLTSEQLDALFVAASQVTL